MAVSGSLISYIAIGIFVIIVFTAIYIGRQLYKERVRKDLENSSKRRELELELGPLPDKVMHESLRTLKITPKSSLENSSTASSSQGKRRKSSSNIERNSKSFDRKVKPRPSRDSSVNGSSKYDSTNGSRYSRSVSKQSSLAIKIPNEIPPPPPPSPLKSQDDSIKTLTNIIPSDISGSTYTPPHMSSKASSQIDLKTHSLMPSQPTTHVNYPEFA